MDLLSTRLKKLREDRELMQKEVASYLNITTSAYGFYEQGKRSPTPEILSKLADFFNVSVDYLLCKTDIRNYKNNEKIIYKEKKHSPEIETIAEHPEGKEITPKKIKMIKSYIDALFDDEE